MGKSKRRSKGMGRVYKENGAFYLQYTTPDHKRKAMILREANGDKITEERRAEAVAKKFLDDQKKIRDIETREEYLEERAKLKKFKARMTISLDDAFDLAQQKPRTKMPGQAAINKARRHWQDFVAYVKDSFNIKTLDQVERNHAESYIAYLREHGRYITKITYYQGRGNKGEKFRSYRQGDLLNSNTINKYMRACKSIFTKLLSDMGFTMEENPFFHMKSMKVHGINREIFTEDELRLIFKNPPPLMRAIFTIGICTGLRLGDVATLRWDEIEDLDRTAVKPEFFHHEIIRVTRKTNTLVHIPIEQELSDFLQRQYPETGTNEYVVPEAAEIYLRGNSCLSGRIKTYLRSLGIQTQIQVPGQARKQSIRDFHSLRHCFCYYAGLRGVPLPVVQSIVGHLSESMTKHYQSHADKQARIRGLSLMRGLTSGQNAVEDANSLLRKNLVEYVLTASNVDILKLNVFIAQLEDAKTDPRQKLISNE